MYRRIKSSILLLCTALIWGFGFVAQRVGNDYIGVFSFVGIRFLLGAAALIPVIVWQENPRKQAASTLRPTLLYGAITGVILFLATSAQQYGILLTNSAGKSSFITGLYTVWVPIIGAVFGKKTGKNIWIGAFLALTGLFLLSFGSDFSFGFGDLILLLSSFLWAGHVLLIDRVVNKVRPMCYSQTQFLVCGILGIMVALCSESISLSALSAALWPLLYGGILSSGGAFTLQILGQKDADPTYASILLSMESVFGALGGWLLLHEQLSSRALWGCALIFAGILLSQFSPQAEKAES